MPMMSVQLVPGVNTQKTLTANQAGVSISQLIRYKDGMIQSIGGWDTFIPTTLPSTVRALHAWQDLTGIQHLGVGATQNLSVVTNSVNYDITPQTRISNPTPNFSITSGSNVVTVADPNSNVSTYDTVFFNTPTSVGSASGGILLNGPYAVNSVLSTGSFTILSSVTPSTSITSSGVVPVFATSSGTQTVTVTLTNNNFEQIQGDFYEFFAPTVLGSSNPVTVQGPFEIASVIDSTNFTINLSVQASTTVSAPMNGGNVQLVYYVALGPAAGGVAYGAGNYGAGPYGTGTPSGGGPGTPISATDWTLDNWGEALLACPANGPIYTWSPDSGLTNAQVIPGAPFFNGGIFVSQPQQILVAWASCQTPTDYPGTTQDPLMINWSDSLNYTNWAVTAATAAGGFHIPTGSYIAGGLQAPSFGVFWTDIDCWIQQYVGGTVVFNFTRVGAGCGLVGRHAAGVLGGNIFWMSFSNFYWLSANGVAVLPCTVYDFVFQNINTAYLSKVVCSPNAAFNEVTWYFPSGTSTECNAYATLNTVEGEWNYGSLTRTAWTDISVLGNPIGIDTGGQLWQHEEGTATPGTGLPGFQTGWWSIAEGNELAFVDWIMPDMIWGQYSATKNAQVNLTFYSANYPGDTPIAYGPYTVTQQTEYITPRIRGRLMSVAVQSAASEFWRLGKLRYRFSTSGRR